MLSKGKTKSARRTIMLLAVAIVVMFSFSFALVPMYNVFCKVAGINGKPSNQAAVITDNSVDEERWVTVEFFTTRNAQLPWDFHPEIRKMRVHPGSVNQTAFYAENQTDIDMTVQAIPSISPGIAANYFKKLECFCFTQQSMAAHTGRDMPLQFVVSKDLPAEISTISLSYTLFDLTGKS